MSFNCTPHSSHRLLNTGIFDIPCMVCIIILVLTVYCQAGSPITGTSLLFTAYYKAGGFIDGAGLLFSLFLS